MAYKVRIAVVEEDESGVEVIKKCTDRPFGEDKEKAEGMYEDAVADMMCMD